MDASFVSKPLSQLECRDNKKSCHLLEKKGTHPMRMYDNNTTCNRSNQNAGFLDTTNTTCNRSNQNVRLPDTHSHSTNQHPATPDTAKTTCYQSAAQCWKAFLVTIYCYLSCENILLQFLCGSQTQKFRGEANNISALVFYSWFKLHKAGKLYIICISAREQAGKKTPTTPAEAPAGEYMQQYLPPARPLPNLLNFNIYDWAIFSQYSTIHSARSYYFPFVYCVVFDMRYFHCL